MSHRDPRLPELLWILLLLCSLPAKAETQPAPPARLDSLTLRDVVELTLAQQPEIRIAQQQVAESRGLVQQQRGLFDLSLRAGISQRGAALPISPLTQLFLGGPASVNTATTSYSFDATSRFRWGMIASASVEIKHISQNTALAPYAQSDLVFSIVQPLLRGRGRDAAAAGETAALLQQEASQHLLRDRIAQSIRDACVAYIGYVAAFKSVERWRDAEGRAQQLLSDEQRLVEAGQHPASSIRLLSANLAEVESALAEAERQMQETRQALAVAMGLSWQELLRVGPPQTTLPPFSAEHLPRESELAPLIQTALRNRPDLLAAEVDIRAAQVFSRAARRGLEPRFDAQVELGYTGLSEGSGAGPYFAAPYQNVQGVNFLAGLSGQLPVQNNVARGLLVQRQAEEARARLRRDNLARQIGTAVTLLATSLRAAVRARNYAEDALEAYQGSVEDERKKLRAGFSTIFDLVQVQSRWNTAAQSALSARARVASLLVRARFETGTLLSTQGAENRVDLDVLAMFPRAEIGTGP